MIQKRYLPHTGRFEAYIAGTTILNDAFFTSIVGGHVEVLDPGAVYAGGVNRPLVVVKFETPNGAFNTTETRRAFIEAATRVVDECTVPSHDRGNTWVTIWNAPDCAWGLGGVAYTNDALVAAIASSSS